MAHTILSIGAFDTKAEEYLFVHRQLQTLGAHLLTVNIGVLGSTDLFQVDIESEEVARAANADLQDLVDQNDRGAAMKIMAEGAAVITKRLFAQNRFSGIIGMGGSGGTSVITSAMRCLPIGVPKVCVSTAAGTDTSAFVGFKDVTLIPSITDVSGVNRISSIIFTRAAGAIWGMVNTTPPSSQDSRPIVAASMFGNTTECVDTCRQRLTAEGFEVLVFHAIGTGGKTMESLIEEGLVDACLDITTTEWADEICGGVFSAGPNRLSAAGKRGIPHLIVPGCVDMANFGPLDSVPQKYRDDHRLLYEWNPAVTLMRTNKAENEQMGKIFAEKANAANGPISFLFPLRGLSILDGDGERFCDREADQVIFDTIRQNVHSKIPIHEVDANINDQEFADRAVGLLLAMIRQNR